MDVTTLWTEIVLWLTNHAPTTAAVLRVPDPLDVPALESEFRVELPDELRDWWSCCGGTEDDVFADVLPPFYTPYGAERSLRTWQEYRKIWPSAQTAYAAPAGTAEVGYHPAWIPIAGDGFADELVVDLRPGPLRGCVLEWEQESARSTSPEWSGVSTMLADVRRALREGGSAGHSHPTITEDGRLDWQVR